jgi:hypothetical protein
MKKICAIAKKHIKSFERNRIQGHCAECSSSEIDYSGSRDIIDIDGEEYVPYPYTCRKCGFKGVENYELVFKFHTKQ